MKTILFQGDSITDCGRNRNLPISMGQGYPTMVAGTLGVQEPYKYTFLNRGISGNRSIDVYARIKCDIINLKPDYLSILMGVNDAWHDYTMQNGIDAETYEKLYCMMIEQLQRDLPQTKIMILEPFVLPGEATCKTQEHPDRWEFFSKEVALRAQAAKRVAEKYGIVFVPLQELFNEAEAGAPVPGYWLRDGVHPTKAGHELIKREWLKGFEKLR